MTLKDIYLAAHKAAETLAAVTDEFELQSRRIEEFNAAGLTAPDFKHFCNYFDERRNALNGLATVPTPSVLAAKAAALAAAPAPADPEAAPATPAQQTTTTN